jgi:hypothetical protein
MSTLCTLLNGTATVPVIHGRGFKHRGLNKEQRASLAAAVVMVEQIYVPTQQEGANLFNVSIARLQRHMQKRKTAAKNGNGQAATLVTIEENGTPAGPTEIANEISTDALVERVAKASESELLAIAKRLNTGVLWQLIETLLDERMLGGNGKS